MNAKFAYVLLLLTVMTLVYDAAGQISINHRCGGSSECRKPCARATGYYSSKCINGSCVCYGSG
uniref:Alpha-KTx-like peptide n=1 Tax=Pandinus cavimanus TaxID=217261 RepID=H2CYS1_PANCV|nr:alpha-KTx-like peptide [Pandinus cavimanus]